MMEQIKSIREMSDGLIKIKDDAYEETDKYYTAKIVKIGKKTGIIVPEKYLGKNVLITFLKKMKNSKMNKIEFEKLGEAMELGWELAGLQGR